MAELERTTDIENRGIGISAADIENREIREPAEDEHDRGNRESVEDGHDRGNGKSVSDGENRIYREAVSDGCDLISRKNRADSKTGRRERIVVLSGRMQMLADMVTAGNSVADVGCDHAFLPIYLVQTGRCPGCLAMDVRKGPISGAEEHIASYGLEEYIETRLSDGLSAYHKGEAQTLVCAGMGGRLMERILTEGGEKTRAFSELILQPQSEIPEFRIFLRAAGFLITEEEAVCEDGKYYFAMKAVYKGRDLSMTPPENELHDLYGKQLLLRKHPVLRQYLLKRRQTVEELIIQLGQNGSRKSEARKRELSLERRHLESALDLLQD